MPILRGIAAVAPCGHESNGPHEFWEREFSGFLVDFSPSYAVTGADKQFVKDDDNAHACSEFDREQRS